MQETVVIRQRGQITIPKKLRDKIDWLSEDSVVGVVVTEEEVCLSPKKKVDSRFNWKEIWEKINLSRSFIGKKGNLSEFISKDRLSH